MASVTPNSTPAATGAQPPQLAASAADKITQLMQEAVEKFEKENKKFPGWDATLREMEKCNSLEAISAIFEREFFNKIKKARGDKWLTLREKYLKPAVGIIIKISEFGGDIAESIPSVPGGKMIFTAISFLLKATKGVSNWFEGLEAFFSDLNHFLNQIWKVLPFSVQMGRDYQNIVSETFLCTIELIFEAMEKIKKNKLQMRFLLFWKAVTGSDDEITEAQNRLKKLMDMARDITIAATAAQTMKSGETVEANHALLSSQGAQISSLHKKMDGQSAKFLEEKLKTVKDAKLDKGKVCWKGTRVQILDKISQWILTTAEDYPQMLLLHGAAGTGKSAISHTIGKKFSSKEENMCYLGAFFAFKRNLAADPFQAVQAIAHELGKHIPDFKKALIKILEEDSDILDDPSIEEQWEKLITKPAKDINQSSPVVIILDALDEITEETRKEFIALLMDKKHDLPKNFHIFMTSRSEHDIMKYVDKHTNWLDTVDMNELDRTAEDISKYVFGYIAKEKKTDHINEARCKQIAETAGQYFQWAVTVCKELCMTKGGVNPGSLFDQLMKVAPKAEQKYPLDEMYRVILKNNFDSSDKNAMENYRKVVSQILSSYEPLSSQLLQELQRQGNNEAENEFKVDIVIEFLGSLFVGVHESDKPVWPIHTSILDFLLDRNRSEDYAIDKKQGHMIMALGTIRLMNEELHFNMCKLESSHVFNSEVKDLSDRIKGNLENGIDSCISPQLQYSAQWWASHVENTEATDSTVNQVRDFISSCQMVFWLECMSLMGKVIVIIPSARKIRKWAQMKDKDVLTRLQELEQFTNVFSTALHESTPHLYVSGYALLPLESPLRKNMIKYLKQVVKVTGVGRALTWERLLHVIHAKGGINSVVYSPDGQYVVSGSWDNTVGIWDAQTGVQVGRPLRGHTSVVDSVAYSPDCQYVVSGSKDKTVRIWNAQTGVQVGEPFEAYTTWGSSVAYSPDGQNVVSGSGDKTIRIWNTQTGVQVMKLIGHTGGVNSAAYSPNGQYVVSGSKDKTVRIWNAPTGVQVMKLMGHTEWVTSVAYSPDGQYVVSGSKDETVRIWNAPTGVQVMKLMGHTEWVTSVAYSPDGQYVVSGSLDDTVRIWNAQTSFQAAPDGQNVVSGSGDKTIRIWNAQTGVQVMKLIGHTDWVTSVAYSPDGQYVVSGSLDKTVRIWNAQTGVIGGALSGNISVISVAYSPDGQYMVSGSRDKTVRIWNAQTGVQVGGPLNGHTQWVTSVAYSPDGQYVVSGSGDNTVRIWNAQTSVQVGAPLSVHTSSVTSVAYSPDGQYVVSGSEDKTVRIWNAQTDVQIGEPLSGHTKRVTSVAYSPDGQYVVSGSADKTVRVWNAQTGVLVGEPLSGHTDIVTSVAYSPNGQYVVSGSWDHTVRIWNAQTGVQVGEPFKGHTSQVTSVAYSPDGQYVVSGSWDCTVRTWNAQTGVQVGKPFKAHTSVVTSVANSPDGQYVVSGSLDGTVRIWKTQTDLQVDPAHDHLMQLPPGVSSGYIDDHGWLKSNDGQLILWLPPFMRESFEDKSQVLTIPADAVHCALSVDWSNFVHGTKWTQCWDSA
ncbi:hypothetical protein GYMLUDRAFT_48412 [Collybiopsis luxurians FD-317 M1]|uniref:NACHT domain-containing protein n=1 Tax=Collybiopsis luxurians FD-317 M1 TaxID=944289 RepID=A0A0D0BIU2_9AGAR|nr:hypothetical protein GYMLUDRAFT_48412 [Collybiopsis luxurians FD-317 M1]